MKRGCNLAAPFHLIYQRLPHVPRRSPLSWLPLTEVSTVFVPSILIDAASMFSAATLTSIVRGDVYSFFIFICIFLFYVLADAAENMLAASLKIDNEKTVDTSKGGQLSGERRGSWGNLW